MLCRATSETENGLLGTTAKPCNCRNYVRFGTLSSGIMGTVSKMQMNRISSSRRAAKPSGYFCAKVVMENDGIVNQTAKVRR